MLGSKTVPWGLPLRIRTPGLSLKDRARRLKPFQRKLKSHPPGLPEHSVCVPARKPGQGGAMRTHKPRPCPAGFSLRANRRWACPCGHHSPQSASLPSVNLNGTPSRHPPPHRPASGPGGLLPVWKNQGAAVKRTGLLSIWISLFSLFFFYS